MRKRDHSRDLEGVAADRNCQRDTSAEEQQWWSEHRAQEDTTSNGTLCSVGMTAMLRVEVAGSQCEALLDTGASRSFISPGAVERLQLKVRRLPEECVFTVANGAQLRIDHVVKGLTMWCGATRLAGDFLVGPVPYDLVVGLDWLTNHRVAWYFQPDKLRTYVNGQWCDLPVVRANDVKQRKGSTQGMRQRTPAEQAYDILAKQVADMTREEATALLLPPSKRLYAILVLPAMESNVALRLVEERQGALCCAMVEASSPNPQQQCVKAPLPPALPHDEEISPWSTAKLEYSQFDTWLTSPEAQATPRAILDVLCAHRAVFPDKLLTGLPPKRPHDHRILLVPGKLPTKSAIYRMTPEQLQFHKQDIAKLSANGWIGPTYSPICAPTIIVDKRSDGTGERKMRIVVNYQELNALTIAPDLPLPAIQTILEMLGGAQYFSTLDLEARPQANFNAYLQPLLGQGVIAYLDDVLMYSPDLPSHVTLLQQVLRIFLDQQFYPKFSKCKFAKREFTYLGYTISAEGIKPAADKIQAIKAWLEVLENETQIRQFLGTVNYCRMFMGPDFAHARL
ncbi:OSJNBa0079C19.6 protein, related [Eimeria brunetti]|uniref:OSJNBa0079C19.6 protein, related n=1 Tax=Eimeria brunetti TaxID=51314 RepID=U6LKP0_9EIME|nr:OSJNBa0079C19.6 protein, related [Eimeria brunetti]